MAIAERRAFDKFIPRKASARLRIVSYCYCDLQIYYHAPRLFVLLTLLFHRLPRETQKFRHSRQEPFGFFQKVSNSKWIFCRAQWMNQKILPDKWQDIMEIAQIHRQFFLKMVCFMNCPRYYENQPSMGAAPALANWRAKNDMFAGWLAVCSCQNGPKGV